MSNLREEYNEHQCWGMVVSIDLRDCQPQYIKDPKKIQGLIDGLCAAIQMKKFGPTQIARFAEGALEGYSAIQFIETSSITLHFDETKNRAFIDIFSCKFFELQIAADFCQKFLEAATANIRHYFRR